MQTRVELDAAYRATEYCYYENGRGIVLRIDENSPLLDRLLQRYSATTWAYITACNPNSIQLSDSENVSRLETLQAEVECLKFTCFSGEAIDPTARWPAEPSLLVLGICDRKAVSLARRFGQLALLTGTIGEPVRLTWTGGAN